LDLDLLADSNVILAAVGTVVLAVVVAASVTVSKEELLQRRNNKRDYIIHQRIDILWNPKTNPIHIKDR